MFGTAGLKCAIRRASIHAFRSGAINQADFNTIQVATSEDTILTQLEQKVYALLHAKGSFTAADGSVQAVGNINWLGLLQLLISELPQILALILPLLGL